MSPSVFLIEINPRAPGHRETIAIEYTYGIDYWALHILSALPRDSAAVKKITYALSQRLAPEVQHPTYVAFIPLERGGTFVESNMDTLPEEMMEYMVEYRVHIEAGEVCKQLGTGGEWPFVAFFNVAAKLTGSEGRAQAKEIGDKARAAFEYVME